jgi:hypothetical protein
MDSPNGSRIATESETTASPSTPTRRKRETTWEKAFRFLIEGKVQVTFVSDGRYLIRATVEGDHGTYVVDYGMTQEARWSCSCPSYSADCSHARAVQRVTSARQEQV